MVVAEQQLLQIADAGADVFRRIERIQHAESSSRGGHQLHQAHRAFWRNRPRVERRFHLNDRANQLGSDALQRGMLVNEPIVVGPNAHQQLRSELGNGHARGDGLIAGSGRRRAVPGHVGQHHDAVAVAPGIDLRPRVGRQAKGQHQRKERRESR